MCRTASSVSWPAVRPATDEQVTCVTLYGSTPGVSDAPQMRMPSSGVSPDDDIFNRLLKNRIVILGSVVDDAIANKICAQLLLLAAEDSDRDIYMHINSPGGSVTAGMAIYDTMQHIKSEVVTICVGLAASMGAFLLAAGNKGKRLALPHSRIMIHQPLGGAGGQATDIDIQAQEIINMKKKMTGILSKHTGRSEAQITKDIDRDYFLSAEQAKEYGIVDHIISPGKKPKKD